MTKRCRRLTACSLVLVLASCGGDGYLASRKEPTEQEQAAKEAEVEASIAEVAQAQKKMRAKMPGGNR